MNTILGLERVVADCFLQLMMVSNPKTQIRNEYLDIVNDLHLKIGKTSTPTKVQGLSGKKKP